MAGKTQMTLPDFLEAIEVAIEAVKQRGKATTEEKTMLDAMIPSLETMKEEESQGADKKQVLEQGVKAAWQGVEHTKELIATKGRASYVGERGIGHQDPGATSYSFLLEVIAGMI